MRRAPRLAISLALASLGLTPLSAWADDTVLLKDGRELSGRVIDRGNDTIELELRHGSLTILRKDIVRIDLDKKQAAERDFDVVVLRDGNYVRGDVTLSKDGGEVIVRRGQQGLVKHPRAAVAVIHWRDGREEVTDPTQPGAEALQRKIERLLDDMRQKTSDGKPDLATRAEARRELLAIGVFARKVLEQVKGPREALAKEVVADLNRLEEIRRAIPSKIEKKIPRVGERLISPVVGEREAALRTAVMEFPKEVGPLLLFVVKNDSEARLRAYAVAQLSALRSYEELAQVLKIPNGPLRLAAAFALGDAGIYVGVPVLINALRIEDLDIRQAAVRKLREYTKQHFGFRPKAPAEDREPAIERWNKWWAEEGKELALQSIKEAAPRLKGGKVSEAEQRAASKLWREASAMVSSANEAIEPSGDTPAERERSLAEAAKSRRQLLEQAMVALDRALELDPSLSSARLTRAALYYEEFKRPEAARKELRRILDRADHDAEEPENARKSAYYHLGRIAMREKQWREAAVSFGQALDYDPKDYEAREAQGDAYFELALSMKVSAADPTERKAQLGARGEALQSALAAYRAGLEQLDAQDEALVELVKGLRGQRKGVEESQVIQSVRRNRRAIDRRRASLHFRIGRLQAARKHDDLALQSYREAARFDPQNQRYAQAVKFWERLTQKQGK